MYPPGGNHYDATVDGALSAEGLAPFFVPAGRSADAPIYTRRQLRGKIAGELTKQTFEQDRMRRVWPDEPNVGWSLPEMAFRVDGNLRVGGPTLKTYILNNLSMLSRVRESLITMNDTYRKLQASEDQLEQADMLNAVGSWKSEEVATVGTEVQISRVPIKVDARTYTSGCSILRRGSYEITYRIYCIPDAGSLTLTLAVGAQTFTWDGSGLPTTLTVTECVPYEKTDDATDAVTLTLTVGTSAGDPAPRATFFQIAKLR